MSHNIANSFKHLCDEDAPCPPAGRASKRRQGLYLANTSQGYLGLIDKVKELSQETLTSFHDVSSTPEIQE